MKTILACCVLVVILGATSGACTKPDPGDRKELEAAIDKSEDRYSMAAMAMRSKTRRWLDGRPKNERIFKIFCQVQIAPGGPWTEKRDEIDLFATVADMIACMDGNSWSYDVCIDEMIDRAADTARARWKAAKDAAPGTIADYECQEQFDPGYNVMQVPGAKQDLNRVSAGEIVEWFLSLPAPPVGLSVGTWRALAPFICALGKDWGCAPGLGGDIVISPAPSGGTGDYP